MTKIINATESTPKKRGRPVGSKNIVKELAKQNKEMFDNVYKVHADNWQKQIEEIEVPQWIVPPFYHHPPKMPFMEKLAWAVMFTAMVIIAVIIL